MTLPHPHPIILAFIAAVTVLSFVCLAFYVAIQRQREASSEYDPYD